MRPAQPRLLRSELRLAARRRPNRAPCNSQIGWRVEDDACVVDAHLAAFFSNDERELHTLRFESFNQSYSGNSWIQGSGSLTTSGLTDQVMIQCSSGYHDQFYLGTATPGVPPF